MKTTHQRGLSLLSVLLLLVMLGLALHFGINALFMQERPRVEAMLAEATGAPAQVERTRLVWEGGRPRLSLEGVRLLLQEEATPPVRLRSLRLGVRLPDLLRGRLVPYHLQVAGLQAVLREDAQGRWRLGAGGGAPPELETIARNIAALDRIALADIDLSLQPRIGVGVPLLRLQHAELSPETGGWRVHARLQDAAAEAQLRVSGRIEGEAAHPRRWRQQWMVHLEGDHDPSSWLDVLRPGWELPHMTDVALTMQLRRQGSDDSYSWLGNLSLDVGRAVGGAGGAAEVIRGLHVEATSRWAEELAVVDVHRVEVDGTSQAEGLRFRHVAGAAPELQVQARRLALDAWSAPLVAVLPGEWPLLHGQLQRLDATLPLALATSRAGLRYTAELDDVGVDIGALRVSGVSGQLRGDSEGGRFALATPEMSVALPAAFDAVPELRDAHADLDWRHAPDGTQLQAEAFGFRLDSIAVTGVSRLHLPDAGAPYIEVDASMRGDDASDAKPLMPKVWHPRLRDYLDEAILRATVKEGDVRFAATLAPDFWQSDETEFHVGLDIADGAMRFHPDWPAATELDARLDIDRKHIAIRARRARYVDLELRDVGVDIGPMHEAVVSADITHRDTLPRWYAVLAASPLANGLSGLLTQTVPAGEATLSLDLHIPLADVAATRASGSVEVDGAQLALRPIDATVSEMRGVLHFVNHSVAARDLRGRMHDQPVTARLDTVDRITRLYAESRVDLDDDASLARYVPGPLRERLHGVLPVDADITLTPINGETRVDAVIDSGPLRSALPQPLAFEERAGRPPAALSFSVADGGLTGLDLRLPGQLHLLQQRDRARLHLGTGMATPPEAEGLYVSGTADEVDVIGWIPMLRHLAHAGLDPPAAAAPAPLSLVGLRSVSLDVGRLRAGRVAAPDVVLRLGGVDRASILRVDGSSRGEIHLPRDNGGVAEARFERIWLERVADNGPAVASHAPAKPLPPPSPAGWPAVDLLVSEVVLEGRPLGELDVRLRQDDGMRLEHLSLGGGLVQVRAEGLWRDPEALVEGAPSVELTASLRTSDIHELLDALGYARTLQAEHLQADADLQWSALADIASLTQAEGTVHLEAAEGTLHQVRPGAGRAIGLLNLYALPRRLAMNFRDVTDAGMGFDAIRGSFALADGNAHTDDLRIDGPALRINVRGRVGLAARDYDQQIEVYPQVSGGITLGAAVLGGPVGVGLAVLVRELFDAPLDRATRISYRLTGSWDEPEVEPKALDVADDQ